MFQGIRWTPSKMIHRLGKEINNTDSVYYWAYKVCPQPTCEMMYTTSSLINPGCSTSYFYVFQNNIPVFSPALTDGSLGDMIYFHSFKNPGLVVDIVEGKRQQYFNRTEHHFSRPRCLNHLPGVRFRYSKAERYGGFCQENGNDHPGRRAGETSYSQC